MLDKLAGLATQIRDLERSLKEMDTKKANPTKVKEITDVIKDLKSMLEEKKQKKEERRKKKEESAKAEPKVEATVQPTEVVKESAPTPTEEVVKEADVNKFAIDSKVEPIRGTPGSWGVVIREAGINGDPLCYVKWHEGTLKEAHGEYGAYYPSDLRLKAEVIAEAKDPTDYVPREQLYNLEADLKSNYEKMISDLQEEIKTAQDKGEYAWVGRLEEKLADAQKAYKEKFSEKHADSQFKCENCGSELGPLGQSHLENLPGGEQKWTCNKKKAEDENGSGGTTRLKVVDQNPPYDKDPQEKSTGYGGDRPMGAMIAPNSDENSLPLESSLNKDATHTLKIKSLDDAQAECSEGDWHFSGTGARTKEELEEQFKKHTHKKASLKFADLDLDSIDKRWALYVDGKLAIRTLTRSKAERIAKERFPEQVAAGKYEIKREDHTPVEASLDKQAINITVGEKLFVVNPLAKTADNEYCYDVNLANGSKLFKITSKEEMGQEHLTYVIGTELGQKKEAKNKCVICNMEFDTWPEYDAHKKEKHSPKMAKLTSNLAFLKKGSFVSILDIDNTKKQVKFASLDGSLRGWAPMQKFATMDVPEANLIDHEGHKDEVLADNGGKEILVICPAGSVNVEWRTIEAPPATPESLNDIEAAGRLKVGDRVRVSEGSGLESGVTGTIVSMWEFNSNIGTNERGVPNIEGYYKPVDWSREVPLKLDDGSYITMFKNRVWPVNPDVTAKAEFPGGQCAGCGKDLPTVWGETYCKECSDKKGLPQKKADEEMPENEQSEEDIYIHDERGQTIASSPAHGIIAKQIGDDWEMLYADIDQWMIDNNFFPSVWWVSDHGNVHKAESFYEWTSNKTKTASLNKDAHIRHEDGKWVIYSHDFKKKLGTYDSKEAAEKRLKQIEYFKHEGSLQPLSKKEAVQKEALENQPCDESGCNEPAVQYGHGGVWCAKHKKSSNKEASSEVPMPADKCEECGKELGPEAFLSKWPVCGKCTKKRHEKALGKHKKADQDISLEQQVQGFRDRMNAVTERLANPPAKTADLETTQDLSNVDVKDLSEGILHMIDMIESKVGENVSADPELHPMLEDLENKVYEIEMKLGIKPELPEHEKAEPEHKEIVEEVEKESAVEVKADDVNTPPQTLPPTGFKYAWDPKNMAWILVQITGAPGGGY